MTKPDTRRWADRLAASSTEDELGCWLWTGKFDRHGYGRFYVNGTASTGAHRAAWMAYRGDIPDHLVIDHLCRVRRCINPWHMDLVTVQVNTQRGQLKGRVGRRRTACAEHGMEDGYLYQNPRTGYSHWICRPCRRATVKRWKQRHRAA